MRAGLAAILVTFAALGLQLAMVIGVIRPDLFLAFLGYTGLFAGMLIVVPGALRRARPGREPRRPPDHGR